MFNIRLGLDIDGVLTQTEPNHRLYLHIKGEPYRSEVQRHGMPNLPMIELLRILHKGKHEVFLITGRLGMLAHDRTCAWLREYGLEWLATWTRLYINFEGDDPSNIALDVRHKIRYIKRLNLAIYVEDNESIAEELREKTSAMIIHYRR